MAGRPARTWTLRVDATSKLLPRNEMLAPFGDEQFAEVLAIGFEQINLHRQHLAETRSGVARPFGHARTAGPGFG